MSVGLPVYNGEDYLEEAIRSILDQDYRDLELIISDNASTDRTEAISRKFAAEDDRIVYLRRPRNIGAGPNFNFAFEMARGEYFKWMAHDDVCRPQFVSRCVAALDEDPSIVLAYPSALDIDGEGAILGPRDRGLGFDADSPYERFVATMTRGHAGLPQFGVVRAEVLRKTALLGTYDGSDRPLLGELALLGRLVELPEELFLHREHEKRSVYTHTQDHGMRSWWDPSRANQLSLPMWHRLGDYLLAIRRAPLSTAERVRCWVFMGRWFVDIRSRLLLDLRLAIREASRRAFRRWRN